MRVQVQEQVQKSQSGQEAILINAPNGTATIRPLTAIEAVTIRVLNLESGAAIM